MPKVPVLREQEVALDPLRPVYQDGSAASLEAFGANRGRDLIDAGQAVTGVSNELSRRILIAQAEDNERSVKQMDTQLQSEIISLLYGNGTEENPGFRSLQGENALVAGPEVQKALEDARRKIAANAPNSRVGEMFSLTSSERINSANMNIAEHTSVQRVEANINASNARINMIGESFVLEGDNPQLLKKHLAAYSTEVQALNELQGGNDDTLASMLQAGQSAIFSKLIEKVITYDPVKAQLIFDTNAALIDGTTQVDLQKKLADANIYTLAQNLAGEIWAESGGNPTRALDLAREKLDGREESAVLEVLRGQISDNRSAAAEYRAAYNFEQNIEAEETARIAAETALELQGIDDPKAALAALGINYEGDDAATLLTSIASNVDTIASLEERATVREITEAERSAYTAIDGGSTFEAWALEHPSEHALLKAQGMVPGLQLRAAQNLQGDPFAEVDDTTTMAKYNALTTQELAQFDPEAVKQFVTEPMYQKMIIEVAVAKMELQSTGAAREPYTSGREYLKNYSPNLRWDGTDPKPTATMLALQKEMERQMSAFISYNPDATPEQLRQEAVRLTAPATVPGRIFDEGLKPGELVGLTPEQREVVIIDDKNIPPDIAYEIGVDISNAVKAGLLPQSALEDTDLLEAAAGAYFTTNTERYFSLIPQVPSAPPREQ